MDRREICALCIINCSLLMDYLVNAVGLLLYPFPQFILGAFSQVSILFRIVILNGLF